MPSLRPYLRLPWGNRSELPEYRCLKILIDDSQGEAILTGTTFKALADGKSEAVTLLDTRIGKSSFDIRAEIKAFFSAASGALRVGGADLGFSQDPSELYVKVVVGKAHRLIARVQLRGVTYDDQDTAIDALDDVFTPGGWGVDFGNAGSAVVHNLISKYPEKSYDDRLTGFQFGAVYDAVNEEGDVIFDKKTGKPVKLMAKELSTDLLVKKMQRQELEYPYDPDLILYYPNHTYRESQNHRIYKKEDDHVIDADRVLMLRQVLGTITNDDFACGSRIR